MNDLPVTLDQLTARLETLEQRIYVLEHPSPVDSVSATQMPTPGATHKPRKVSLPPRPPALFSVLGKAMLGIAGAYLLRAVAESTSLPKAAVAAIAIAYALMWLVWAVRVQADTWIPSAIYAGTSALILAPMLWELTLSFKVLSATAAAAILAAFILPPPRWHGSAISHRLLDRQSCRCRSCLELIGCYARDVAVYRGAPADGTDLRVCFGTGTRIGLSAACGGAGGGPGNLGADLHLLQPGKHARRLSRDRRCRVDCTRVFCCS
jgi:hypothetical protein